MDIKHVLLGCRRRYWMVWVQSTRASGWTYVVAQQRGEQRVQMLPTAADTARFRGIRRMDVGPRSTSNQGPAAICQITAFIAQPGRL